MSTKYEILLGKKYVLFVQNTLSLSTYLRINFINLKRKREPAISVNYYVE